jgi:myo-inositol-1(or 4)-monophosphatase
MDETLEFTKQLAVQAGELLLEYFHSTEITTQIKPDHSAVTQADLAVDRFISESIHHAYPQDVLLSEELQPSVHQDVQAENHPLWIIDPLDGTTNFTQGLHIWGVLIARVVDDQPQTTALYFPLINELYYAQSGLGAFLNGEPIHVGTPDSNNPWPFFSCCSRTYRNYQVSIPYKTRILGSAAYTFCAVARGAAILGFEATPKIWDIAGAWLLVREAGGVIATLDDTPIFPLRSIDLIHPQSIPTLAAPTAERILWARNQIRPK